MPGGPPRKQGLPCVHAFVSATGHSPLYPGVAPADNNEGKKYESRLAGWPADLADSVGARSAWGWLGWIATTCAIAVVLAPLVPPVQARPFHTSDRQAYELATNHLFPGLPVQHVVYVESIPQSGIADGLYCPARSVIDIRVLNDTISRSDYIAILRHEYGHALLCTWFEWGSSGDGAFESLVDFTTTNTVDVPSQLAGVALEYRAHPRQFGVYASSDFAEWLAEAYVSYVAGDDLPPHVKSFYDSLRSVEDPSQCATRAAAQDSE